MSRRDTIIVAVLINAGLLIVLFATALKPNQENSEMVAASSSNVTKIESPVSFNKPSVNDEIEQAALEKEAIAKASPVLPAPISSFPAEVSVSVTPEVINFAADLNGIGISEVPSSVSTTSVAEQQYHLSHFTEIKVKKGDVLEKIARQNHTTVDEIMKSNQLSSTRLKIGQVLKIPAKDSSRSAQNPSVIAKEKPTQASPKYYTVKNGDNPWTIAVKNKMKVEDLLKLNHLNEEKARHLKPGDQLRIE